MQMNVNEMDPPTLIRHLKQNNANIDKDQIIQLLENALVRNGGRLERLEQVEVMRIQKEKQREAEEKRKEEERKKQRELERQRNNSWWGWGWWLGKLAMMLNTVKTIAYNIVWPIMSAGFAILDSYGASAYLMISGVVYSIIQQPKTKLITQ